MQVSEKYHSNSSYVTNRSGQIEGLPAEILLEIFDYLGSPKNVSSFGATCKIFHQISNNDDIWRRLFHLYFPFAQASSEYRLSFKTKFQTLQYNAQNGRYTHKTIHRYGASHLQVVGNLLFVASHGSTIRVLDLQTKKCLQTFEGHYKFLVDGNHLFTCLADNRIKILDLETGECLQTFEGHSAYITSLQIAQDRLFTGSWDGTIKIWNLKSGECLQTIFAYKRDVRCLHVEGNLIYTTCCDESVIKIWNSDTEKCIHTLKGHNGAIDCLQVFGDLLYTGSWDGTIKIWNLKTRKCVQTLKGHKHRITCLQVEGSQLITGSFDETVKIWNLKNAKCVQTFKKSISLHPECLLFTRDRLFVGSKFRQTIEIWDFDVPPSPFESFLWKCLEGMSQITETLRKGATSNDDESK